MDYVFLLFIEEGEKVPFELVYEMTLLIVAKLSIFQSTVVKYHTWNKLIFDVLYGIYTNRNHEPIVSGMSVILFTVFIFVVV